MTTTHFIRVFKGSKNYTTLLRTLVDCTEMPFAHGHLYVASSRVLSPDNIAYYFEDANEMVDLNKKAVVTNIV